MNHNTHNIWYVANHKYDHKRYPINHQTEHIWYLANHKTNRIWNFTSHKTDHILYLINHKKFHTLTLKYRFYHKKEKNDANLRIIE